MLKSTKISAMALLKVLKGSKVNYSFESSVNNDFLKIREIGTNDFLFFNIDTQMVYTYKYESPLYKIIEDVKSENSNRNSTPVLTAYKPSKTVENTHL